MTKKDTRQDTTGETGRTRVRRAETITLEGLSIEETARDRLYKPGFNPYDKPLEAKKKAPNTTDLRALSAEILAKRGKPGG